MDEAGVGKSCPSSQIHLASADTMSDEPTRREAHQLRDNHAAPNILKVTEIKTIFGSFRDLHLS